MLKKYRYHWLLQFLISLILNQLFSRCFFRIFHPLLLLFQCGLCICSSLLWDIPFSFFLSSFTSPENKLTLIKWFLVSWQNPSVYFCHGIVLEPHFERPQHKATQMSAPLRRYHQLITVIKPMLNSCIGHIWVNLREEYICILIQEIALTVIQLNFIAPHKWSLPLATLPPTYTSCLLMQNNPKSESTQSFQYLWRKRLNCQFGKHHL